MFKLSSLITLLKRGMTSPVVENKAKGQAPSLEKTRIKGGSGDVQEAEKECSEKSGASEKPDDGEQGDADSSLKNEEGEEEKNHGKESRTEDKEASRTDDKSTGEVVKKYLEGSELVNNEREEVEQSLENVASEAESNGEGVRSKEKECQPTGDSAKSESAEKDSQEDSSPKEKEEKKDVEKEEEQQQGVKRRVEEEAGGTSRKVVRQSVSVSRLADLELLASLSSSQPGLLKREREEEEEQEQEGEPDSKKSNTVEEESKGLEKEAASRKTDVVKAKKEGKLAEENKAEQTVETPVVASTKLRDAASEASFSSSRSKHKVEEPVVEEISHNEQSFQEAATQSGPTSQAQLPVPILPSSTPLPAQSNTPTGSSSKKKEATPSPTFKETKQIIGAKELQNEKALQRKRLNKMLTIFEDQKVVNKENGNQKFEDSLKLLENQNKLKEPPSFATALPRLPSHDEAM